MPNPRIQPQPADGALARQEPSVTESLVRGELHQQVVLAKQYPREVSSCIKRTQDIATISPEVAASCAYHLTQGGEKITGPSIRFAEILSSQWGNLRTATRTIEIAERRVTVQGICHDLESGNVQMVEVNRGIWSTKQKRRYSDQMIDKTLGAAHSIARRNAILAVIPRALVAPILDHTAIVAAGSEASLGTRRQAAIEFIEKSGVARERVFGALSVSGIEDLTSQDVQFLRGVVQAVREGETDWLTQFPEVDLSPRRKAPAAPGPPAAAATKPAAQAQPAGDVINVETAEQAEGDLLGEALGSDTGDGSQNEPAPEPGQGAGGKLVPPVVEGPAVDMSVLISKSQRGTLIMAAGTAQIDLRKFLLQHFDTDNAKHLPAAQFDAAMEKLQAVRKT